MKNAIFPYLIIAVVGILLALGVSYIGIDNRDAIQNDNNDNDTEENDDNDENNEEDNDNNDNDDTTDVAEEAYESNCASCHGDDLEGGSGPELTEVGDRLSEDEIDEQIEEGGGGMPPDLIDGDEKEAVVEWLSDMD